MSENDPSAPERVEILRVSGDVYINGVKKIFAVDFDNPPTANPQYHSVDWLLGWAKIGLLSKGHIVPHFPHKTMAAFDADAPETEAPK